MKTAQEAYSRTLDSDIEHIHLSDTTNEMYVTTYNHIYRFLLDHYLQTNQSFHIPKQIKLNKKNQKNMNKIRFLK